MSDPTPPSQERAGSPVPRSSAGEAATPADLVERVASLVHEAREAIASYANATLTLTYWQVGALIDSEVLGNERADYGAKIVASLARELTARFGRGFEEKNLRRMIKFAQQYPDVEIVASLARQLSWTHFVTLMPLKSQEARAFYADQVATGRLTVRELKSAISARHTSAARSPTRRSNRGRWCRLTRSATPTCSTSSVSTMDTPKRIWRLRSCGTWRRSCWRSARVSLRCASEAHGHRRDDFHLDLLFFSRPLRRLVAVELKVGKFDARHEGQMKLYLKWLIDTSALRVKDTPIGLILCTEASREQVELLEMHKDGIVVAEYWTALPPKHELEQRLQVMLRDARERLARRELPSGE